MNSQANHSIPGELITMLSTRRPAWSRTERAFITKHLEPLGLSSDSFGNLYKRIGSAPVLWSCHTDTVHTQGGSQVLSIAADIVQVADKGSNCLGADDTAGMWLMMEMIRAEKPGLYLFHRAEEIGGKGSEFIATETPEILDGIQFAIAFDRRGTGSIITHQWGGRCCSEEFAATLSAGLGLGHTSDATGSFTDTANYTDLVGECTNVSVGYSNEHSRQECLDLSYLMRLRSALLCLDVSTLVQARQAGDYEPDADDLGWLEDAFDQEPRGRSCHTLSSLVRDHPDEIADWLEASGISVEDLEDAIYQRGGVVRK
jgi:hypothetical protein